MGLNYRRTKRLGRATTLTASTRGVSASRRFGRLSVSSRGRGSFRLGKGLSFRFRLW